MLLVAKHTYRSYLIVMVAIGTRPQGIHQCESRSTIPGTASISPAGVVNVWVWSGALLAGGQAGQHSWWLSQPPPTRLLGRFEPLSGAPTL